uniref:Uncharacterized protein n=1 Tax=viral metagenome TaxID=1070528 RepID=A0A6M3KQR2_9ZZZZ
MKTGIRQQAYRSEVFAAIHKEAEIFDSLCIAEKEYYLPEYKYRMCLLQILYYLNFN